MNPALEIFLSALLILGGFFTFLGSLALIKLPDFFMRLHGPTKATTLGTGAILLVSSIYFTVQGTVSLHEILITAFLFITTPISAHLMAKAAIHLKLTTAKNTRHPATNTSDTKAP